MKTKGRYWFMALVLALLCDILFWLGYCSHYREYIRTELDYLIIGFSFIWGFCFFFYIFGLLFIDTS